MFVAEGNPASSTSKPEKNNAIECMQSKVKTTGKNSFAARGFNTAETLVRPLKL